MCVLSSFVGLQFIYLVSRVSGSPDIQICAAVSIVNFRTFASPQEEAPYTDDVDINALFPTPTVAPGNHSSLFHLFGFAASAHYMQIEPYNMWFPPRLVFSTKHRVFKVHPCCSTCVSSSSLFMVESCSLMNRSHCVFPFICGHVSCFYLYCCYRSVTSVVSDPVRPHPRASSFRLV